jgi:hypothetical protein
VLVTARLAPAEFLRGRVPLCPPEGRPAEICRPAAVRGPQKVEKQVIAAGGAGAGLRALTRRLAIRRRQQARCGAQLILEGAKLREAVRNIARSGSESPTATVSANGPRTWSRKAMRPLPLSFALAVIVVSIEV